MKIRQGFVSNSSTTSFCLYGVGIDKDLWNEAREHGLEFEPYSEYSDKEYALGLSWHKICDSETGAEFKQRVRDLVRKALPDAKDEEFGNQEDAYRDG